MIHTYNGYNDQIAKFDKVATDSLTAPLPSTLYKYSQKKEIPSKVEPKTDEPPDRPTTEVEEPVQNPTEILLVSVLSGERTIDSVKTKELPQLIQAIKEDRDHKIAHHNIDDAEKSDQLLFAARQLYNKRMKEGSLKLRLSNIEQRISDSKELLKNTKHNFFIERLSLEETHKQQIQELGQRQMYEMDQFRTLWNSPKHQRIYDKPSAELKTLYMQTSLLQHDKERRLEHQKSQRQFASLCQSEQREKARLMNIEYQQSLKKLQRKQKNDLDLLLQKQKDKIDQLDLSEAEQIRAVELRITNLLREKEKLTSSNGGTWNNLNQTVVDKKKKSRNPQADPLARTKPCFADYVRIPLPLLPSASPRRMRLKTPMYNTTKL